MDNLQKIEKDKKQNEIKLKNAYKFYHEHCDEKKIINNFQEVFAEYKKIRELWD